MAHHLYVLGHQQVQLWLWRSLQWRHNAHDSVSNHQPHYCLLNRLVRRKSKKTSKLRVTGLCAGNSPETDEFPAQMASNAETVSIWWRHHVDILNTPESTDVVQPILISTRIAQEISKNTAALWLLNCYITPPSEWAGVKMFLYISFRMIKNCSTWCTKRNFLVILIIGN